MSLQAESLPAVPSETRQVARAAFPEGNMYMHIRDELDSIYDEKCLPICLPKMGSQRSIRGV